MREEGRKRRERREEKKKKKERKRVEKGAAMGVYSHFRSSQD